MSAIEPRGVRSPHRNGMRYKAKTEEKSMLHVAYTDPGFEGTFFGGVVVNPSVMKREPRGHVQVWSIVTLVRPCGPITRSDAEVIAISPEVYNDLVLSEKGTFWPAYHRLRAELEDRFFRHAADAGIHEQIYIPEDIQAEIHRAAERAAHRALQEESYLSATPTSGFLGLDDARARQMIDNHFSLQPLSPAGYAPTTSPTTSVLRPKSMPAPKVRRRSALEPPPTPVRPTSLKVREVRA